MAQPTPLVSLVGGTAAAVASPLNAWIEREGGQPCNVLLLATDQVWATGERLRNWVESDLRSDCELRRIGAPDAVPDVATIVRDWVERVAPGAAPVCNITPGLSAHIAQLSAGLPPRTVFLYAGDEECFAFRFEPTEEVWQLPVPDLGFDRLIELGGRVSYKTANRGPIMQEQRKLMLHQHPGLRFDGEAAAPGHRELFLDAAFETRGRLHVLHIDRGGRNRLPLADARLIREWLDAVSWGVAVELTVVSARPRLIRRLRGLGVRTMAAAEDAPLRWLRKGRTGSPGTGTALGVESVAGDGRVRRGPLLCVCLGPDPSATLVSLFTHRPREAWVCYDATRSDIVAIAARLKDQADGGHIPSSRVHLVPTDFLGRGIRSSVEAAWEGRNGLVDVSPGTKSQTLCLTRIVGAEAWSLKDHEGIAVRLSDPRSSCPLSGPDVLTQAWVCGGVLLHEGRNAEELTFSLDDLLARIILRMRDYFGDPHHPKSLLQAVRQGAELGELFQQFLDRCPLVRTLPEGSQIGALFEYVVAKCFQLAEPDEIVANLKVEGSGELGETADELDLVARFGHRFVVVECKAGTGTVPAGQAARMIAARARQWFGRKALAVLALPSWGFQPRSQAVLNAPLAERWGIEVIGDPETLRAAITSGFGSRSSLSRSLPEQS